MRTARFTDGPIKMWPLLHKWMRARAILLALDTHCVCGYLSAVSRIGFKYAAQTIMIPSVSIMEATEGQEP